MNRKDIENLIANFADHKRYGELTEEDDILLWLMRNVHKLTEGMPEVEEEKPKRKKKTTMEQTIYDAPLPAAPEVPPARPAFNWNGGLENI